MPAPAKFVRLAREFRQRVEELCHFRRVLFRERKSDFRQYDLLAVEVGQAWRWRGQLPDHVSEPNADEDSRPDLERNGFVAEHLIDRAPLRSRERRQLVGHAPPGTLRAIA